MKELSDSAKLYFKDYMILSNLQEEIHDFLDEIIVKSALIIDEIEINDYSNKEDRTWTNQKEKGYFNTHFRFDKTDGKYGKYPQINITYHDIRAKKMDFPNSVIITIRPQSKELDPFKDKLETIDKNIFKEQEISININDIEASVKIVSDKIIEILKNFENAVNEIKKTSDE